MRPAIYRRRLCDQGLSKQLLVQRVVLCGVSCQPMYVQPGLLRRQLRAENVFEQLLVPEWRLRRAHRRLRLPHGVQSVQQHQAVSRLGGRRLFVYHNFCCCFPPAFVVRLFVDRVAVRIAAHRVTHSTPLLDVSSSLSGSFLHLLSFFLDWQPRQFINIHSPLSRCNR